MYKNKLGEAKFFLTMFSKLNSLVLPEILATWPRIITSHRLKMRFLHSWCHLRAAPLVQMDLSCTVQDLFNFARSEQTHVNSNSQQHVQGLVTGTEKTS